MKVAQYLFMVSFLLVAQTFSDAVHPTAPGRHNVSTETTQARNARLSSSELLANRGLNSFGTGQRSVGGRQYRYNAEGKFFEYQEGAKKWKKDPGFCRHYDQGWAECAEENVRRTVPSGPSELQEESAPTNSDATASLTSSISL